ncbi:MAG: hypothetical protein Q8K96_02460 [Rubrivivax sp.]|nr:hypothetical protein [Rubrivivax sp.]
MRVVPWVIAVMAFALVACDKPNESRPAAPAAKAKPAGQGAATAEQVAKEARADVSCPAKNKSAPRASGAPVDDVIGVRPGISYDEALNQVLCSHDLLVMQLDITRGFNIKTYGQKPRHGFGARFAEPRVEWSAKRAKIESMDDIVARSGNAARDDMKPGQAKWYVGTMGLPGQERVINVAREERFEAGASPTITSIEQALLKKYGPPTKQQNNQGQRYITWSYDPAGRLVTQGAPLFNRCSGNASPNGGVNLSPDCGTVVTAIVMPLRENPELAVSLQVGVVDQAGGYQLVTGTEQALAQADQQRREQETAKAAKNTAPPKL